MQKHHFISASFAATRKLLRCFDRLIRPKLNWLTSPYSDWAILVKYNPPLPLCFSLYVVQTPPNLACWYSGTESLKSMKNFDNAITITCV